MAKISQEQSPRIVFLKKYFLLLTGVLFVTPMSDHALLSEFAMNVTTVHIKEDVLFVAGRAFQTHITAKNAPSKKRIEMDVRKLSTQDLQRQTYSMSGKNMASKRGSQGTAPPILLLSKLQIVYYHRKRIGGAQLVLYFESMNDCNKVKKSELKLM